MWNSAVLFEDGKLAKGGLSMRSRKPIESLNPDGCEAAIEATLG
jgi:hypothetical protein